LTVSSWKVLPQFLLQALLVDLLLLLLQHSSLPR
jgi:hypothetical protein